jgi:hypothetical protein
MAACPYRDAYRHCTITCEECQRADTQINCPKYLGERRRVRAVLQECLFGGRRDGEHAVWCRAGADPTECFAWPSDCPTFWKHRALQAEGALQALGQRRPVPVPTEGS